MEESRFFVTNLSSSTKEQDVKVVFQEHGEVIKVELKSKENPVGSSNQKIFAYVTLKIAGNDVQYCLDDVNFQSVKGARINVSLAKESFLERLKREREEPKLLSTNVPTTHIKRSSGPLSQNLENSRKTFTEYVNQNEDVDSALLITKKFATSSLKNGKIVIGSYDLAPLHVIETKKEPKPLTSKSSIADQKRKESLNKMKTIYNLKKCTVQQALTTWDAPIAKKIKFSTAEDEKSHIVAKTNLFGPDDGTKTAANFCLDLKPEHFGRKGEKLLQMQAYQSSDSRFKIDAKFVYEDEASNSEEHFEPIETLEKERDWQMEMIEQAVGIKLNSKHENTNSKKINVRYDPAKDDHSKFLRTESEVVLGVNKNNAMCEPKLVTIAHRAVVSKDVFYVVSDTLKQSLNSRGHGFSLLNLFNQSEQFEQRENQLKKLCNEKIFINSNKLNKAALNPFNYESLSGSDNENDQQKKTYNNHDKNQLLQTKYVHKGCIESFFLSTNDFRLKEGEKFFKNSQNPETTENYDMVRNRLKFIINTKIAKTKKHLHLIEKIK